MEDAHNATSVRSEPEPRVQDNTADIMPNPKVGARDRDRWQAEEATAYLLKWTDAEITQTRINSAVQLRARIQEDGGGSARHLFVLHGLPVDYVVALRDLLDIDASFIEAHVGRRSHRPLRRKMKAAWAHYDYPELVQKSVVDDGRQKAASDDLVGEPPSHMISMDGDAVMLYRASMWLSEKAHVLFLDRPAWASSMSGVSRRRYKSYTSQGGIPDSNGISQLVMTIDADGTTTTLGEEIPSLETLLYENLRDGCDGGREDLVDFLEELMINQWSVFYETLEFDETESESTAPLFWQVLDCLERNLDGAMQKDKMRSHILYARLGIDIDRPDTHRKLLSTTAEWEALLSRVSRRAQLLSHLRPVEMPKQPPHDAELDVDVDGGTSSGNRGEYNNYNNPRTTTANLEDENKRSLNRVTYLGGVLLPFSVVSGILAISEPYGPGGPHFWILWAAAVPLTFVTLGVIYADSIRKAEVWIEVAASGKLDSDSDSSSLPNINVPGPELGRVSTPDLEQAVQYSMSVPIINRLAEPIAIYSVPENTIPETVDEDVSGGEPDTIVEKRWMNSSAPGTGAAGPGGDRTRWRKEELGWIGACATLFQLYKLKKGVPPHLHRDYKRGGLGPGPGPRRAKTS